MWPFEHCASQEGVRPDIRMWHCCWCWVILMPLNHWWTLLWLGINYPCTYGMLVLTCFIQAKCLFCPVPHMGCYWKWPCHGIWGMSVMTTPHKHAAIMLPCLGTLLKCPDITCWMHNCHHSLALGPFLLYEWKRLSVDAPPATCVVKFLRPKVLLPWCHMALYVIIMSYDVKLCHMTSHDVIFHVLVL